MNELKGIEGKLVSIETGATTYNYNGRVVTTKPKNSATIRMDENAEIPTDILEAYELIAENYRPSWIKIPTGYATLTNKFDVKVYRYMGMVDVLGDGHETPDYKLLGKLSQNTPDEVKTALENAGRVRLYYTVKEKYVNLHSIAILDEVRDNGLPF